MFVFLCYDIFITYQLEGDFLKQVEQDTVIDKIKKLGKYAAINLLMTHHSTTPSEQPEEQILIGFAFQHLKQHHQE